MFRLLKKAHNRYMRKMILLLFLLLCWSCNSVQSIRTDLLLISGGTVATIDGDHLEKQIRSEQDFILYIGNESCVNCNSILKILDSVLIEEKRIIYHIPYSDFDNSYHDRMSDLNLPKFQHFELPGFLLFQKGRVMEKIPYQKRFNSHEWLIKNLKFSESRHVRVINSIRSNQWEPLTFQEIENFASNNSSVSILCGSIFSKNVWNYITSYNDVTLYFCENPPCKENYKFPYILHYYEGRLTDISPL